jgi:NAD(P)-dependent dehydrogenase (short-subunit alcohol dehydrogenase family)
MKKMTPQELAAIHASRIHRHPIGRIGKPEEIAPYVVYLSSAEAIFVTGTVFPIDGGTTAQ